MWKNTNRSPACKKDALKQEFTYSFSGIGKRNADGWKEKRGRGLKQQAHIRKQKTKKSSEYKMTESDRDFIYCTDLTTKLYPNSQQYRCITNCH